MLNLDIVTFTTRPQYVWGACFVYFVTLTAFLPFYTNIAYIQVLSKFLGRRVCVGEGGRERDVRDGQLNYKVSPNRYVNIQSAFGDTFPEQSFLASP